MLSLEPWTIFWTVVNVLVLFVALRHFLIKPVMGVIEQRNEMIRQRFDAAQKTQDEANKMKADYEQQLDTAKEQAADIIAAARVRSEKEHSKAIADTEAERVKMLAQAREDIEKEQELQKKKGLSREKKLFFNVFGCCIVLVVVAIIYVVRSLS